MNIPDELLAAYVDGELQGVERARIEQAIAQDAQLAQRVAQQRALRSRLAMPHRFARARSLRAPSGPAEVIDLARVRSERARRGSPQRPASTRRYTLAASLVIGLMLGALVQRVSTPAALTELRDGSLLARGTLARALNEQLASGAPASATVRVGLSFRSHSGSYCRTFEFGGNRPMAGLACRDLDQWQVLSLVSTDGSSVSVSGQSAHGIAPNLPAALLQSVNEHISGEPLTAAAEIKARSSGWR